MRFVIGLKVCMASELLISVQVSYVTPQVQFLRTLRVVDGTNIQQAIGLSGLLQEISGIDLAQLKVGVYSKIKSLDTVLREHDRVEVYRPLQVDPMVARRARANKKRS
jgi:putative ubiquitin-RnfH superfamily antitoxin RatB of RatAB toxin-antitoxin module